MKEYLKEWKLNNPTYFREYGMNNREKLTDYHAKWVEKNKDAINEYQREWRQNNKISKTKLKQRKIEKELEKIKNKADIFKSSF